MTDHSLSPSQAAGVQSLKQELAISAGLLQQLNKQKYECIYTELYRVLVLLNSSFITGKVADLVLAFDWKPFGEKMMLLGKESRKARRSISLLEKLSSTAKKLLSEMESQLTKWIANIQDELSKSPQPDALFEMLLPEVAKYWEDSFRKKLVAEKTQFMFKLMSVVKTPALREIIFDFMDPTKSGKVSILKFEETCQLFGLPYEWDKTVPMLFKEQWFLWHPVAEWNSTRVENLLKDEKPYTFTIRLSSTLSKTAALSMILKDSKILSAKITWNGYQKYYFLGKQFHSFHSIVEYLSGQKIEDQPLNPFNNEKKRITVEQIEAKAKHSVYQETEWTNHLNKMNEQQSQSTVLSPPSIYIPNPPKFNVLASGTTIFTSGDPVFIASRGSNRAISITPYSPLAVPLTVIENADGFLIQGGHKGLKFSFIVFEC